MNCSCSTSTKTNKCLQLRVAEVQERLIHLRKIQLHLLYYGLGLEGPMDDIAVDIVCVRSLMGEFLTLGPNRRYPTSLGFVAEV